MHIQSLSVMDICSAVYYLLVIPYSHKYGMCYMSHVTKAVGNLYTSPGLCRGIAVNCVSVGVSPVWL